MMTNTKINLAATLYFCPSIDVFAQIEMFDKEFSLFIMDDAHTQFPFLKLGSSATTDCCWATCSVGN